MHYFWSGPPWRRFPPPGRLIDIGGRRLHLHCTGEGKGPTVVLETGRFNTSGIWALVQDEIVPFARVCTYDRAGYGWSDPDPEPRTGERVAADLHRLLQAAEIPGPYLLVGHSLGGIYVRYFAQQYPDRVAGVILVDPHTEGEVRGQLPKVKAMQDRFGKLFRYISLIGVPRLVLPFMGGMLAQLHRYPAQVRSQIAAFSASARLWRAVDDEWRQLPALVAGLTGPGSLGALPLLVLRAERSAMKAGGGFTQVEVDQHQRLVQESKAELTQLSDQGRLVPLPETGHGVPMERPEAVVDAVRAMLEGMVPWRKKY